MLPSLLLHVPWFWFLPFIILLRIHDTSLTIIALRYLRHWPWIPPHYSGFTFLDPSYNGVHGWPTSSLPCWCCSCSVSTVLRCALLGFWSIRIANTTRNGSRTSTQNFVGAPRFTSGQAYSASPFRELRRIAQRGPN